MFNQMFRHVDEINDEFKINTRVVFVQDIPILTCNWRARDRTAEMKKKKKNFDFKICYPSRNNISKFVFFEFGCFVSNQSFYSHSSNDHAISHALSNIFRIRHSTQPPVFIR